MKILLATPAYGGLITTDYAGSLLNSLRWCAQAQIQAEVYFIKNESLVSRARNNCASYFLRGDYDKLFFIDSDQGWKPSDFERILRSKRTLVGGTYCKKTFPPDLNFTPLPEHDAKYFPGGVRSAEAFLRYAATEATDGETEVRHLPTGFMLIDRSVFEAMREHVPTYLARDNQHAEENRHWDFFPAGVITGHYETEDFFFCSQAKEIGHTPYLNVNTIIDHFGQINYKFPKELA